MRFFPSYISQLISIAIMLAVVRSFRCRSIRAPRSLSVASVGSKGSVGSVGVRLASTRLRSEVSSESVVGSGVGASGGSVGSVVSGGKGSGGGINIYSTSKEEISALLAEWGQPSFRAKQIHSWMFDKGTYDTYILYTI
jgi:hypothetical protein